MKLALLNSLAKTPPKQRVQENPKQQEKRERSLLSEIREEVDNMGVVEIIEEHQDLSTVGTNKVHFFGIEAGTPEHSEMEEEFKGLTRSNPRLCRKILHLD